jgi:hypothetical protein
MSVHNVMNVKMSVESEEATLAINFKSKRTHKYTTLFNLFNLNVM